MSWWWPFKRKHEAEQAEHDFRVMLSEAMLRQDDLKAATENLKQSRKARKGAGEPFADPALPRRNPRPRNV